MNFLVPKICVRSRILMELRKDVNFRYDFQEIFISAEIWTNSRFLSYLGTNIDFLRNLFKIFTFEKKF